MVSSYINGDGLLDFAISGYYQGTVLLQTQTEYKEW